MKSARLDLPGSEQLQEALAGMNQPAAIAAHVENQAVLRQLLDDPDKFVKELGVAFDVERGNPHVRETAVPRAHIARRWKDLGHRAWQVGGGAAVTRRRAGFAPLPEQEMAHLPFHFSARIHSQVHAPAAGPRHFVLVS
jgi:hypothetical protein